MPPGRGGKTNCRHGGKLRRILGGQARPRGGQEAQGSGQLGSRSPLYFSGSMAASGPDRAGLAVSHGARQLVGRALLRLQGQDPRGSFKDRAQPLFKKAGAYGSTELPASLDRKSTRLNSSHSSISYA